MRIVVFDVLVVILASCAPREKLITGTWKIKDVDFVTAKDSLSRDFAAKVKDQFLNNINLTLEADSTYTIMQLKGMIPTRGKWWFSADKKILVTKTDLGLTESKVIRLTKNSLVFESKDPSGNNIKMYCVPKAPAGSK